MNFSKMCFHINMTLINEVIFTYKARPKFEFSYQQVYMLI